LQLLTIQKELETAREIQLSILPEEIPKIGGVDIAARYIPMTSVAGDFCYFTTKEAPDSFPVGGDITLTEKPVDARFPTAQEP
jgi:hypothetical protein